MRNKTMPIQRFALTPLATATLLLAASLAQAQEASPPVQTVVVTASADASAQGLPGAYAGGQVARGGRLGLLGNVDIMDTPFNTTTYTASLIQDQRRRETGDMGQIVIVLIYERKRAGYNENYSHQQEHAP